MASVGVWGPSSGLSQFLSSLATAGTSPGRPVGWVGQRAPTTGGSVQSPDASAPTKSSAPAQSLPQQVTALIQKTINTLTSDQTANPLDALRSIESSPGLGGLLGQLNVSPQQFRSDILSAISQSANGNSNLAQAFQSFPAGQNLDLLA